MSQSRQLAAIMFTDIVGYTALMGEDEEKALELLEKNRQIQKPIIEEYHGRWLKEIGDGLLASFTTVSDAVFCAKAIQKACLQGDELKLRIGIHQGEVVFTGEDVFGDGVNIASRLEQLAPTGGIVVSESVHRNIGNKKGIVSTFLGEEHLKNIKEPIRVYSIQVGADSGLPRSSTNLQGGSTMSWRPRKMVFTIAGVIIILLLSYFMFSKFNKGNIPYELQVASLDKSIVVLPFTNLSSDPEQEYFSDGITEEILNHLAKIEDLKVISRTTAMLYKGTNKSVREITEELNVATALEGSVRKDGNKIRITVQLIEGAADTHLWSESYDRELNDIFEIQSDIAELIAEVLQAEVTPATKLSIKSKPTNNVEAYNLFLQAQAQNNAGYILKAIELLEEAIAIDPQFADAFVLLGHHKSKWWSGYLEPWDQKEALAIASSYYRKALEIDPDNGLVHQYKATMHLWYEWDFAAAERECQFGVPNGFVLEATGRFEELLQRSKQALETDPLSPYAWRMKILGLYHTGQQKEALQTIEESKTLDKLIVNATGLTTLTWSQLDVYTWLGMYDEVIELMESKLNEFTNPRFKSCLAISYFHTGQDKKLDDLIKEINNSNFNPERNLHYFVAQVYAQMGEIESAFGFLETAYSNHETYMALLKVNPYFQTLHHDSRWQKMLDKVGFPM